MTQRSTIQGFNSRNRVYGASPLPPRGANVRQKQLLSFKFVNFIWFATHSRLNNLKSIQMGISYYLRESIGYTNYKFVSKTIDNCSNLSKAKLI